MEKKHYQFYNLSIHKGNFYEHMNLVSFVHAQKVLNEALEKLYDVEIRLS